MSTRSTLSARISLTLLPPTLTGLVAARLTVSPPTVTAKSAAAGTEPSAASRPPSKVTVSVLPLTAAEEKAGGLLLVADLVKPPAALPERSCSESAPARLAW